MIQTVITHHCTKCNSIDIVKNGKDYRLSGISPETATSSGSRWTSCW